MKSFIISVFTTAALGTQIWASEFEVDKSHTNINFEVAHLVISTVTGRFDEFSGSFSLNDKNHLTSLNGTVKASSIDTDNEKRDKHLRSADFFDAEKYPELKLTADGFDIAPGKSKKIKAKLSMHGVTKDISVEVKFNGLVKDPWGNQKAGITAEAKINRKDFGLNWNETLETGGVLVGEEVKIVLNIQGKEKVQESKKTN